jgi:hypothetical protein
MVCQRCRDWISPNGSLPVFTRPIVTLRAGCSAVSPPGETGREIWPALLSTSQVR